MVMSGRDLYFEPGTMPKIIKLSVQTPECIVVIVGDDPTSVIHGAELRDDRLKHNDKDVRLAISN